MKLTEFYPMSQPNNESFGRIRTINSDMKRMVEQDGKELAKQVSHLIWMMAAEKAPEYLSFDMLYEDHRRQQILRMKSFLEAKEMSFGDCIHQDIDEELRRHRLNRKFDAFSGHRLESLTTVDGSRFLAMPTGKLLQELSKRIRSKSGIFQLSDPVYHPGYRTPSILFPDRDPIIKISFPTPITQLVCKPGSMTLENGNCSSD
jgi:hypothetical protein